MLPNFQFFTTLYSVALLFLSFYRVLYLSFICVNQRDVGHIVLRESSWFKVFGRSICHFSNRLLFKRLVGFTLF